jgi:hypothetical protein
MLRRNARPPNNGPDRTGTRFAVGRMEQLKLLALDADDLDIIAAHVQDAVMRVDALIWRPAEKRFAIEMNRFAWERQGGVWRKPRERRRSALVFDRVMRVASSGFDRGRGEDVLVLLTIGFAGDDPPGGTVELLCAGGAAIRLEVECIEARLADLGAAWEASSRPDHGL